MAEVFKRVNGMKIEKYMAKNRAVQSALRSEAQLRGAEAARLLELVKADPTYDNEAKPHSYIKVHHGKIDWWVSLVDERSGTPGAMSIEYGRKATDTRAGMAGKWVLHDAFGLPHG